MIFVPLRGGSSIFILKTRIDPVENEARWWRIASEVYIAKRNDPHTHTPPGEFFKYAYSDGVKCELEARESWGS